MGSILQKGKIVVLGSGVMGSGIAAHLANCAGEADIDKIYLLDIVPPKLSGEQIEQCYTLNDRGVRNLFAQRALGRIKNDPNMGLMIPEYAQRIIVGNVEDDLEKAIPGADWVIEVVPEVLEIKRALYDKVIPLLGAETILSSNTSGISIKRLMDGYPIDVQERFLVTHFFNPVRHMKLLELVAGEKTSEDVTEFIEDIGRHDLGKGVVWCNDTPGFVGNRIGVEELAHVLNLIPNYGAEMIDYVLGKHMLGRGGKPVVTCEMIGLETMVLVGDDIYKGTAPFDGDFGVMPIPDFLRAMVTNGQLGAKTGKGFYAKKGKEVFDLETGKYVPSAKLGKGGQTLESVETAKKARTFEERVNIMFEAQDKGGEIWREIVLRNCAYALMKVGEVSPEASILPIDQAMEWGYNRDLGGPGKIIDAIGLDKFVEAATKRGYPTPEWAKDLASKGKKLYGRDDEGFKTVFDIKNLDYDNCPETEPIISFKSIGWKSPTDTTLISEVKGAVKILDVETDILGVEIISKKGTINAEVIREINHALDLSLGESKDESDRNIESDYKGIIIANTKDADFSLGADLYLMCGLSLLARKGSTEAETELESISKGLQDLAMRIKYHELPVVIVKQGQAVGGGCELGFGAHIRASAELYTGLVEFAVGLVPGGGGMKELLLSRRDMRTAEGRLEGVDPMSYVNDAVEYISWNWFRVSSSADDAIRRGWLKSTDKISRNTEALLEDAIEDVNRLTFNYQPPRESDVRILLPGKEGYNKIICDGKGGQVSGWVVHEFVPRIMEQIALVYTTGPEGMPEYVTERELLDRERKAFMNLALGDHLTTVVARQAFKMDKDKFETKALKTAEEYLANNTKDTANNTLRGE
ncbi:3-hydroxyacyl-CoA dehydrogenase/enoyl-CoA hydratase family protein [Candidatus Woesearchaeota archaeon]|nr:3-hydroxyacyl-CoA dehydrogenase/enoyl-CoA hydratase family protein [Candidatus Woesearchaeota archaeon]